MLLLLAGLVENIVRRVRGLLFGSLVVVVRVRCSRVVFGILFPKQPLCFVLCFVRDVVKNVLFDVVFGMASISMFCSGTCFVRYVVTNVLFARLFGVRNHVKTFCWLPYIDFGLVRNHV